MAVGSYELDKPTVGRDQFRFALLAARKEVALSQRGLALALHVSQPLVSRWETGRILPSPERVFLLERTLALPQGTLSRHLGYTPT